MHPNIKRWEEGMNICKGKKIKINNRYALSQTEVQVYEHTVFLVFIPNGFLDLKIHQWKWVLNFESKYSINL